MTKPRLPVPVLVLALVLAAACGGGSSDPDAAAALDPGRCTFTVSGGVTDAVTTEARGITEYQGSAVLLFECTPDITQATKRLRLEVNGYAGPGSYPLDDTSSLGRIQVYTTDGEELTNYPGATGASCTVQVTADDATAGVVGTFSCTGLTDSVGQPSNVAGGQFAFHGVPPNVLLVP